MGRTLENKQQIVEELKQLLGEAEMALVLDYQGLSIKEMSDLRTRLQASKGVCKVTKNTLMRRAIDGDGVWSSLDSLLSGTNAFVLIKGDVGGAVKAVQSFQKRPKNQRRRVAFSKASSCLRMRSKLSVNFRPRKCSKRDRWCRQRSHDQDCCWRQRGSLRSCKSARHLRESGES